MSKFTSKASFWSIAFLVGMLFPLLGSAQTKVSGTVVDATQEPLAGVSVSVKGSPGGSMTNTGGKYEINVAANATLVFSFVGMKTQEIATNGRTVVDVTLEDAANTLDEVVVSIGYGTVRKKDLTGAVASIGSDKIAAIPVASAMEAISGRLAGVQITTTEGSPDAEMRIRVRGGGSITGDNTPLFIVDGFPVSSISDIPPSDIESIDVLKDASSTAIYGSRGANGVIIVTTKSGKTGKMKVTYNVFGGPRNLANKLDVLTPADYASWQYERSLLDNNPTHYTRYFGNYSDIDLYNGIPSNDWQEIIFGRTGYMLNNNLNISGGSDKTKFTVSYNNIADKAIMQMSNFNRNNLNFRLNNRPHKKVTLDFAMRYSSTSFYFGA